MTKKIIPFLKLTFVLFLLYYLVKKGFISVRAIQTALQQRQRMLGALGALIATTTLGVFRWQWLLKAQNIHMSWIRTFQLTMIGIFFNIALPGAVSGDFVKAFYVGKEIKGKKSRAFGSILFDRVAGLSALVLVSAGALALGFRSYLHSPLFSAIQFLIEGAALCVLFFYGYLFLVREHHDPLLRLFRKLEKSVPKTAPLARIYESLRHYHNHRMIVFKVLALSVMIHLIVGWSCLNFAQALGDLNIPILSLYVVVPLGLLLTAIPVAPAGVGTGNLAFLYLFNLMGSERGADVYSLLAVMNILIGAIGGIIYFRFKSEGELPKFQSSKVSQV